MSIEAQSRMVAAAIGQQIPLGREIGVQVTAYLNGKIVIDCAVGLADSTTGTPVTSETLFNVFSVAKAVSATAVHMQVAGGHLSNDSRIADFWPEYGCRGKEATTVVDVLSHRAGVPQMPEGVTPETMVDRGWMMDRIADFAPIAPPGEEALYHSMTFGGLVDEIIEISDPTRRIAAQFIHEGIAGPLDAPDLWFGLPQREDHRVAKLIDAAAPVDAVNLPRYFWHP